MMRCSNCGKDIPFIGRVCPFCHADKASDKASTIVLWLSFAFGGVPGLIFGVDRALQVNKGFSTDFFLTIAIWTIGGTIAASLAFTLLRKLILRSS